MANLTTAYISLGSNLGDRETSIERALRMLADTGNVQVARVSDIIETPPLGGADQPNYLNAVAEIKTTLNAQDLYSRLAATETALGRVRDEKWSSRVIDLDLLLFGSEIMRTPNLTVPHPQMHLRSFVLSGLCQLDPRLAHPVLNEPISELAARLNGADFVLNPNVPQLICVAGVIGVGKTTLAQRLSDLLNCKLLLEPYDKNPYLPKVYAGQKELALDSQQFFLNSRIDQLTPQTLTKGQIAISDYVFDKELIYAGRLLDPRQFAKYKNSYQSSRVKVAQPVLVIYLQDSPRNCLERIHQRNRPYEQIISLHFLEELNTDYERLFADWKSCPLIRISMSQFDCTRNGDINHLSEQITDYVILQ
jgi:2-amino-4-hydroxy-6-hydroxymethyldihydropteridine diphosphokinase